MLNLLDKVIEQVLDTDWPSSPPGPAKPSFYFAVPDDEWHKRVSQSTNVRLNLYLYEVRENREFRRSSWDKVELPNQTMALSQPPAYFDCHYLISAWSPTKEIEPTTSPIPAEHEILSEALRILMRNPVVNPSVLGVAGGGPVFQQAHVYLVVAPPEAPRVLNDFWSSMKQPWRLAIQLIVTAPLDLLRDDMLGPAVLTLVQRYVRMDSTGNPDEVILIGGWVQRNLDGAPIPQAIVRRVKGTAPNRQVLEEVTTDDQGRFVFIGLRGSTHTFNAVASGFTDLERTLDISTASLSDHVFKMS